MNESPRARCLPRVSGRQWMSLPDSGPVNADTRLRYGALVTNHRIAFNAYPKTPTRASKRRSSHDRNHIRVASHHMDGQCPFDPSTGLPPSPTPGDVPFEVKPWLGPRRRAPINAGEVPPDFTHTWAIDLMGVSSFSLQYSGIQLLWDAGDSVVVLDFTRPNPVAETYASDADLTTKSVPVPQPPDGGSSRFYVTLRTGPGGQARQFRVPGLHTTGLGGHREALIVADDLNYDQTGPLVDPNAVADQEKLYAPWKPESPGVPVGVSMPPPGAREGWHLLARNLSNREAGFLSLLYYNERTSRLRAYLYNATLSTDATYIQVNLSLATRAPGANFLPLTGAFFNADPRPQRWSSASFTVPVWPQKSWAFVEAPMLYPMADALPAAQHPRDTSIPSHYYRPVYEEACESGLTNAKIVITVQGFQVGSLQGDILGQAIGNAVQQAASSGLTGFDLLNGAASALASGKDYYDKGQAMHKALTDFLKDKQQAGTPTSDLQGLQALVGLGAGAFGGFLGVVGLGIGIYQAFFSKPEPLRLALELAIRGTMTGSMFTPLMPAEHTFFLPGRWSIQESAQSNFPVADTRRVDAEIARYDRTLGHFGWRYNPARVQFRVLQAYYAWDDPPEGAAADLQQYQRYVFPAKDFQTLVDPPTPNASTRIPEWLPIIYNPYAEITPLKPLPVATAADHGIKLTLDGASAGAFEGGPAPWFDWLQDISPASHVTPEPGDESFPSGRLEIGTGSRMTVKVFPDRPQAFFPQQNWLISLPNGIWLSIPPDAGATPRTCRDFVEMTDLDVHTWWDVWLDGPLCHPPDYPYSPFPLRDVIYYWDVAYFHYPRSRQAPNGDVDLYRGNTSMSAPVRIDHRSVGFNYTDDDGQWFLNRPGVSGDSKPWEGWSHAWEHVEEVSG
jgi:hypothetical protein